LLKDQDLKNVHLTEDDVHAVKAICAP
jgi:hypothetical protein